MARGVQLVRRQGQLPRMDIAMSAKELAKQVKHHAGDSNDKMVAFLDPDVYKNKDKDLKGPKPHLAGLAKKRILIQALIGITKDGDGQCVMSDLRAVLHATVKDLKIIFPVGSAVEVTNMLACKYHLMLHDLRWLAQEPARFF
eukprot:3577403-Pyramimonas_sp.AAC.1